MNIPLKTRWIIALLFLAISAQALVFAPALHDFAIVLWGLSFVFLIGALTLAVTRPRAEREKKRT